MRRTAFPAALLLAALTGQVELPAVEVSVPPPVARACGWPDAVQVRSLDHAARMMPAALQRLLRRHRRSLIRGALQARREGAEAHTQGPLQDRGTADRLALSLARITALLDGHAPLREVAREMGVAAHLVADLSNPFMTAPGDPDAAAFGARFGEYVQRWMPDLRVVFEGYTDPLLEAGLMGAFGRRLADQSRSYLDDVIGAYRRFDATGDQTLLDERSIPFGVASLSFSRSVTDTARAWLHAWRQANGDLTGLPYPLEESVDDAGVVKRSTP